MKSFLFKSFVFSIPIALFFFIPILFLKVSGENYTDIDDLLRNNKKYLIGYAYNESNYKYLKIKTLESREKLSIIALGSSRILPLRQKMFGKSFYNAGYTIRSISDFITFIENSLQHKYPEVLIICLDQWMFNENWDKLSGNHSKGNVPQEQFNYLASVSTMHKIWSDLVKGKFGVGIITGNNQNNEIEKIGLNALVNNKGFRNDGSMFYGDQITKLIKNDSTANDFNYSDTYARIDKGNKRFEFGNKVNPKALVVLNNLLEFCKLNKIYVVGLLPSFADKVNAKMQSSGNYMYMDSLFIKSDEVFKKHGFELWDMTFLGKYGSNDKETVDGFHGGEVSYLRMLIYMVENGSLLKDFTNLQQLKNDLGNKYNNYIVYQYY